tara:strand:+ start:941 stop:1162 length:222 start_codon:yes stop_codon:yes gene_type:complete
MIAALPSLNEKGRSGQERPFSNIFADKGFTKSTALIGQIALKIKRRFGSVCMDSLTKGIYNARLSIGGRSATN